MAIDFSEERWQTVRANYRKWWAGKLDRPLIQIPLGGCDPQRRAPELPHYAFHTYYDESVPAEAIVDLWDYGISSQRFAGDSFPVVFPNFGPGVLAALLGAALENREPTVWFRPVEQQEVADIRFEYDDHNYWWNRLQAIMRAATDRWEGLVQVGATDLGGNLDILSTFRPGERLLLDLYDAPDEIKRLTWEAHDVWWLYFDRIREILQPRNPGYTCWTPIFSQEPYYMLQCDFAYMIGPETFDEFVRPELAASCSKLTNPFYHLDGPGQLPHLDSLLSIPELKGIQWVPGDGHPDVTHWPEVYRRIRDAGKLIQFFQQQSDKGMAALDIIAEQLGSAKGIIFIGGASIEQEDEVMKLLEKYGAA